MVADDILVDERFGTKEEAAKIKLRQRSTCVYIQEYTEPTFGLYDAQPTAAHLQMRALCEEVQVTSHT